jgi:hypothetical protein
LRGVRIAAPVQLSLELCAVGDEPEPQELWESLPEEAGARLLSLFAGVIARSVIVEEKESQ